MNLLSTRFLALASLSVVLHAPSLGHAQEVPKGTADVQSQSELDPHLKPASRKFESPELFMFELHGGPYKVFSDKAYGSFFSDDSGPNLGAHLDGVVYRIPKLLYVTLGGSVNYQRFTGNALDADDQQPVGEETRLTVVPLIATAGLRFDGLARLLKIPLILAGRIGWEWGYWATSTGERSDATGWAVGPYFSAQVALDLDTFEPGGARALDEEWGINHTYIFGEVFHFATVGKSLDLDETNWLLGLGLVF